jgi:GxxExxY protein
MDEDVFVDDDMEPDPDLNRITNAIIGAGIEVHRNLGPGFQESVYEEAMAIEMELRGIPFQRQVPVKVYYKGRFVGRGRMDFLVEGRVVVDLKTMDAFTKRDMSQVSSYLKMTGHKLGILLNFNVHRLKEGIRQVAN